MMWMLFYYNSLPDMPKGCRLFSNDVMHRDFFKCNPTNTNHYEYPKFETLSYDMGCHCREVERLLERDDPDKYVIFYTRHTSLDGKQTHRNKVVGYFKVGKQFKRPKKGFYASERVLLPKNKCIEINYKSRGVLSSRGKSDKIHKKISVLLNNLRKKRSLDISCKYKKETKKIMNKLHTLMGEKEIIKSCEECESQKLCFWGRKMARHNNPVEYLKRLYMGRHAC